MDQPSIRTLRRQAKALLSSIRTADAAAMRRARSAFATLSSASDEDVRSYMTLRRCQFVVAREAGHESWASLIATPPRAPSDAREPHLGLPYSPHRYLGPLIQAAEDAAAQSGTPRTQFDFEGSHASPPATWNDGPSPHFLLVGSVGTGKPIAANLPPDGPDAQGSDRQPTAYHASGEGGSGKLPSPPPSVATLQKALAARAAGEVSMIIVDDPSPWVGTADHLARLGIDLPIVSFADAPRRLPLFAATLSPTSRVRILFVLDRPGEPPLRERLAGLPLDVVAKRAHQVAIDVSQPLGAMHGTGPATSGDTVPQQRHLTDQTAKQEIISSLKAAAGSFGYFLMGEGGSGKSLLGPEHEKSVLHGIDRGEILVENPHNIPPSPQASFDELRKFIVERPAGAGKSRLSSSLVTHLMRHPDDRRAVVAVSPNAEEAKDLPGFMARMQAVYPDALVILDEAYTYMPNETEVARINTESNRHHRRSSPPTTGDAQTSS